MTQIRKATNDDANAPAGGLNVVDIKNVLIASATSNSHTRSDLIHSTTAIMCTTVLVIYMSQRQIKNLFSFPFF